MNLANIKKTLISLPRFKKNLILTAGDSFSILTSLAMSSFLVYGTFFEIFSSHLSLIFLLALTVIGFNITGVYNSSSRYSSDYTYLKIITTSIACILVWQILLFVNGSVLPINLTVLYSFCFINASILMRYMIREFLKDISKKDLIHNIIVYGVNKSALSYADTLRFNSNAHIIGFLTRDESSRPKLINNLRVYDFSELDNLIQKNNIDSILIHNDDLKRDFELFGKHSNLLRLLPTFAEFSSQTIDDDIRKVDIADILGREVVKPDQFLMKYCITGKNIFVTGAGGSIGSELCRQVIKLNPNKLIIIDNSEYALYKIKKELDNLNLKYKRELHMYLGSICDQRLLNKIHTYHKIDTVYHAAAYKHVPIVEDNAEVAVENNIVGTYLLANTSKAFNVSNFVFISSDKAVKPSNIMGVTKRFSEMIITGLNQEYEVKTQHVADKRTRFCIVRFGNVCDSSGSVIELFREQLLKGGPLTVTDKNATRYFMTIKEATQLVIQAGSLSTGGEIFFLEMGDQININRLAKSMISLSGKTLKDEFEQDGDIFIDYIGLRPGEKISEELQESSEILKTQNEHINRVNESSISFDKIKYYMKLLNDDSVLSDSRKLKLLLNKAINDFDISKENKRVSNIKDKVRIT